MAKTKANPQQDQQPQDELDRLAAGNPLNIIALLLWKNRHANPELTEKITPQDLLGFRQCVEYLKVTPAVRIERPAGLPAQDAIPAAGNRRAIAARAAEPPRPFVVVGIVEAGTVNSIRPIENNEEDNQRRIRAEEIRRTKEQAPQLAAMLEHMIVKGEYSDDTVRDCARALKILAAA